MPENAESKESKTEKLTTKAPRHQGMQMGTWKFCQFFLVPLCTPQGGIEKNAECRQKKRIFLSAPSICHSKGHSQIPEKTQASLPHLEVLAGRPCPPALGTEVPAPAAHVAGNPGFRCDFHALACAQSGLPGHTQAIGAVLSGERCALQDAFRDMGGIWPHLSEAFNRNHYSRSARRARAN